MDTFTYCPSCTTPLNEKDIDGEVIQVCPSCHFEYWRKPKPVVSILLSRSGKILMLQRAKAPLKGFWVLPGGFIRYDETPEAAVLRETKEEIGVTPAVTGVIGAYRIDNDPRGIHIDIIYEGTFDGSIRLSSESKAYEFFEPACLPKNIAYKHRQAIQDWLTKIV